MTVIEQLYTVIINGLGVFYTSAIATGIYRRMALEWAESLYIFLLPPSSLIELLECL